MASLLICTDIFGVTPHLVNWAESLEVEADVIFVSPFVESSTFENESAAYTEFTKAGGVEEYAKKISLTIDIHKPSVVIGFSAGGAGAYQSLCTTNDRSLPKQVIGFYPGQIRHVTHLIPQTNCLLYFAHSEIHFDVDKVVEELGCHEHVVCHKTAYKHGFMNQSSVGFSPQGSQEFTHIIKSQLQSLLV